MPLCCAYLCKNIGKHRFPTEGKRRRLWINSLRLKNWKPNKSSRICSDHFKPDDFYDFSRYTGVKHSRKNLAKSAVPSIFVFSKTDPPKSKRQLRLEARASKQDNTRQVLTSASTVELEVLDVGCETTITDEDNTLDETFNDTNTTIGMYEDKATQINIEHIYGLINRFKNDDTAITFYTGFETYEKFYLVYSTLSPFASKINYLQHKVINLSHENQFFLTLMKLRQNKTIYELSKFFGISCSTVTNIFITWINFIYQMWNKLDIWPSRDLVTYYMPESFRQYDKTVRIILDGTEFPIQKPGNTLAQQASWSTYKHSNTLKDIFN